MRPATALVHRLFRNAETARTTLALASCGMGVVGFVLVLLSVGLLNARG